MKNYLKIPVGYFYKKNFKSETISFAVAFLKYLTKKRLDDRYYEVSIFLEKPKTLGHRKRVIRR